MIHIYDSVSLAANPRVRTEVHALRYRVFKERQNWQVKVQNGLEIDEFDDPSLNPIYFVSSDETGAVNATWRLLPTQGPNMLRDVFSDLMGGAPVPEKSRMWEASRFAVDADCETECGLKAFGRITAELLCALGEYCIPNGIREVITVYDVRVGRLLRRVGASPVWSSKPKRLPHSIAQVATFEISERMLAVIRENSGIYAPVIAETYAEPRRIAA